MSSVWVPVADSALGLTFLGPSGALLTGSTVVSNQDGLISGNAWSLALSGITGSIPARATISGYNSFGSGGTYTDAATLTIGTDGFDNSLLTGLPTDITGFAPSQIVADLTSVNNTIAMTPTDWGGFAGLEDYSVFLEVFIPQVECAELGRATRAYVSGYNRDRVHSSRLYAREKRCLIADFNGALPAGRAIASIVWDMQCPVSVAMSDASIHGREARCMIQAVWPGWQPMRCLATMDNGEVYSQLFMIQVQLAPYFGDNATNAGPTQITA